MRVHGNTVHHVHTKFIPHWEKVCLWSWRIFICGILLLIALQRCHGQTPIANLDPVDHTTETVGPKPMLPPKDVVDADQSAYKSLLLDAYNTAMQLAEAQRDEALAKVRTYQLQEALDKANSVVKNKLTELRSKYHATPELWTLSPDFKWVPITGDKKQ